MDDLEFKYQYREISRVLEKHHAVFYKMWEYGTPVITDDPKIPTACLQHDPRSYKPLQFCFNRGFWEELDTISRAFVIAHECLHAILRHGPRSKAVMESGADQETVNVAMDVAVNHMLITAFGFERDKVEVAEGACWVDTVFKGQVVSENLSFEEYYELLIKQPNKPSSSNSGKGQPNESKGEELQGSPGKGQGTSVKRFDDHSGMGDMDIDELMKEVTKGLNNYDISTMNDKIQALGPGNDILSTIDTPVTVSLRPSTKWEQIVKRWKKMGYNPPDESEIWTRQSRRICTLPDDAVLPVYDSTDDDDYSISRLSAWIFLDVSGSCRELKEQFFMAYDSIPAKRFDKKMFIFADSTTEIFTRGLKENVGSGTSFRTLAAYVDSKIKKDGIVPDIIMVITDGDSEHPFAYSHPNKWHWFLDNPNKKTKDDVEKEKCDRKFEASFSKIPDSMKRYILDDFFVPQR